MTSPREIRARIRELEKRRPAIERELSDLRAELEDGRAGLAQAVVEGEGRAGLHDLNRERMEEVHAHEQALARVDAEITRLRDELRTAEREEAEDTARRKIAAAEDAARGFAEHAARVAVEIAPEIEAVREAVATAHTATRAAVGKAEDAIEKERLRSIYERSRLPTVSRAIGELERALGRLAGAQEPVHA